MLRSGAVVVLVFAVIAGAVRVQRRSLFGWRFGLHIRVADVDLETLVGQSIGKVAKSVAGGFGRARRFVFAGLRPHGNHERVHVRDEAVSDVVAVPVFTEPRTGVAGHVRVDLDRVHAALFEFVRSVLSECAQASPAVDGARFGFTLPEHDVAAAHKSQCSTGSLCGIQAGRCGERVISPQSPESRR